MSGQPTLIVKHRRSGSLYRLNPSGFSVQSYLDTLCVRPWVESDRAAFKPNQLFHIDLRGHARENARMYLLIIVIVTTVIICLPTSIVAYLLLELGRRISGVEGMKVASAVAVVIAAVPLLWATMQYWRSWIAGISLLPQYGDQYLGYALSVAFICVPIVVAGLLRWLWKKHPPTPL